VRSFVIIVFTLLFLSCSFDYGAQMIEASDLPDLVMNDVEYVRVQGGDPVVRFRAGTAERYESRQTMELTGLSFEQFIEHGEGIGAEGSAGKALVDTGTNNISLDQQVRINSEAEDFSIESPFLEWRNKERLLQAKEDDLVRVERSDGTVVTGRGFSADARARSWTFTGAVEGTITYEDGDEADASGGGGD
jgi:LPS export ABC transporter protein LptC